MNPCLHQHDLLVTLRMDKTAEIHSPGCRRQVEKPPGKSRPKTLACQASQNFAFCDDESVHPVEFIYLVFARMPGESYSSSVGDSVFVVVFV